MKKRLVITFVFFILSFSFVVKIVSADVLIPGKERGSGPGITEEQLIKKEWSVSG